METGATPVLRGRPREADSRFVSDVLAMRFASKESPSPGTPNRSG